MIIKLLEILRIAIVGAAYYFGYSIGYENGYHPEAQLHIMIPVIIVAIAGLSGVEGFFWGNRAAKAKGFEIGSNYQKQSAIALLSYAVIAYIVYYFNWGIRSELTILFTFMFFMIFSSANHAYNAVSRKNYKWTNINRPFLTLMLIAGLITPVIGALKNL